MSSRRNRFLPSTRYGLAKRRACLKNSLMCVPVKWPVPDAPAGQGAASCSGAARGAGAHDAAEAEVRRRGVDWLGESGGGTIAAAVVRRAQVRTAPDHLPRDADPGLGRIAALFLVAAPRILRRAARLQRLVRMLRMVPV